MKNTLSQSSTKVIIKNSIILAIAFVVAKILGAFYRIPLTNILTEKGIGIYQIVFPLYSFSQVLLTSGLTVATTKMVAETFSSGNTEKLKNVFISAIKLSVYLGLTIAGFVSLIGLFVSHIYNLKLGNVMYTVLTVCLVVSGIASTIKAYFLGRENMMPTAITTLCEQAFKLVFGLLLSAVLLKFGIEAGVLGAIIGVLVGELVVLCVNVAFFKKQGRVDFNADYKEVNNVLVSSVDIKSGEPKWKLSPTKDLIKIALPVTIASSIVPLMLFIDSLIVVKLLEKFAQVSSVIATNQYGVLYGVVNSLINMPIVFASAVSLSLLPNLTKNKNSSVVKNAKFALQLSCAISLVFACLFAFLPNDVILFLYKNSVSSDAIKLLQISSVLVFVLSLNGVLTSVFHSSGKFWQNFYVLLTATIIKYLVLMVLVLTKHFNIYIACYLNIGFYSITLLINYVRFAVTYRTLPSIKSLTLTLLMFFFMVGGGFLLKKYLIFSPFLNLLIGGAYLGMIFVIFCYFMFKNLFKVKTQKS